jgi:hypothetical protein
MLRKFYRTDRIAFAFVSDEFNGVIRDNNGLVRPVVERSFSSLSQAEKENAQSRIYLGIHWAFDATEGIAQGNRVADYVFKHALLSRHHRGIGRPVCFRDEGKVKTFALSDHFIRAWDWKGIHDAVLYCHGGFGCGGAGSHVT